MRRILAPGEINVFFASYQASVLLALRSLPRRECDQLIIRTLDHHSIIILDVGNCEILTEV